MSARNIAAISALTPLQEGILFHVLKEPERQLYHSQFCATLTGPLDGQRWHEAWTLAIARHGALRTLFTWEGRDKPLQIVREHVDTPWQVLDWLDMDVADEAQQISALLQRDRDLGFDLTRAPLLRLILVRLRDQRHRFVFSFHHLILDGWSMRLVLDDVQRLYRDLGRGNQPAPEQAPSFTRYVEWLDRRSTDDETFWRQRLGDFSQPVFPTVADTDANTQATHHVCQQTLAVDVERRLGDLARALRITMSSLLSAAWALLLARYAGSHDVVFGTTVAGRPPELDGAEDTAGLFINTLALRVEVDETLTVSDFLADVHARQVALRGVEHTPLVLAQRASAVAPGQPLFESIVVFESFPATRGEDAADDLTLTLDTFVEYSHFPLALLAVPGKELRLMIVSDPTRLGPAAATDLLDNLVTILTGIANSPGATMKQIPGLSPAQHERAVHQFNQTSENTGEVRTLWDQFLDHARRAPEAIAVVGEDDSATYAQLATYAQRIAARLQQAGTKAGDPVIVMAPRDTRVIAGVLGVMAAGCAYVPVSAKTPPARMSTIARDLANSWDKVFLLAPASAAQELPADVVPVDLDVSDNEFHDDPVPGSLESLDADALAYVIYTSGSTGTPKGVAVTHRNLFHSIDARDRYYGAPPDTFALLSDLSTDSSVAGLFWTLGRGGKLVIIKDRAEQDMAGLADTLASHQVTHLLTVPALYGLLLEHLDNTNASALTVAIVAGEACPPPLVERHGQSLGHVSLHNEYGPTEATVWCSATPLTPGEPVTIGRAIANTRLYVLDPSDRPVAMGVSGQLCVAGAQVAQGYVGDAQRTAQRFVPNPFVAGERMYRTGDLVRRRRDGQIDFVGRVDDQIKVRGYRVEPGEIEACAMRFAGVEEAAAVLNNGRLVACVTVSAPVEPGELRDQMARDLAEHMVPQAIHIMESLPRTAAGKIDRQALAALTLQSAAPASGGTAPTDETERALANIWMQVLGIDQVGIHDDFFALGGDSLLSIRILARAGKAGLTISPADFFAFPTIAEQARKVSTARRRPASQSPEVGPLPLLPIQRWFFDHIEQDPQHWNLSYRFELGQPVSLDHLQRAISVLVTTHDALRSAFEQVDGQWQARMAPPADVPVVSELDLSGHDGEALETRFTDQADRLNASFDLTAPPLLRVCLVRTPPDQSDQMIVVIHHLVIDAESWRIVLEDLALALEQLAAGRTPRLPPKTDSLRVWATRLEALADGPDLAGAAATWARQLRQPVTALVPAQPVTPQDRREGQTRELVVALESVDTQALFDAMGATRSSIREMLLAAVMRALGLHSGQATVRIEMEGHGRETLFDDVDITRTVGWMTSAFPVTVHDDAQWSDVASTLRATKSALRELPHNGLSYGLVLNSNVDSDDARTVREAGRADVLLNYLGQRANDSTYGNLRLLSERCGRARSNDAPRAYLLEINAFMERGRLVAHVAWPQKAFEPDAVQRLTQDILDTLRALSAGESNTTVPEDFPLASLDSKGLSDLSALLDELDD